MAIIVGTAGDDVLTGTAGEDTINGSDGNDTIDGKGGPDRLFGDGGNDRFIFSSVLFSSGPSTVGIIDGGAGYDTVDLTSVAPVFSGVQSKDGRFYQAVTVGSQSYELREVERLQFGGSNDNISFYSGYEPLLEARGGLGNDRFSGVRAGLQVYGEEGDDTFALISGSFGTPPASGVVDGGAGFDTAAFNISFNVDVEAGLATSGSSTFQIAHVERYLAAATGGYVTTFLGSSAAETFDVNTLFDDGATGVVFDGRGGNDILFGGKGNDVISGGVGNDRIEGRGGNDLLDGGAGADFIDGGDGIDTVSYASSATGVIIDVASLLTWDGSDNDTLSSIENSVGSSFNDTLIGDGGSNILDGGAGDDVLDGGAGADTLIGGIGSDTVRYASSIGGVIIDLTAQMAWDGSFSDKLNSIENVLGSRNSDTINGDGGNNRLDGGAGGADIINGYGGSDTVSYGSSTHGVIIDLSAQLTWDGVVNDTLSSIENAVGSALDDTIQGDSAANVLDGGSGGTDAINGGDGMDTISYASSRSGVIIDLPSLLTWDGSSTDTLSSMENAKGSAFNDIIIGNAGDNVLDGSTGDDTLYGGAGNDTFVFRGGYGNDTIRDMALGADASDVIDFKGVFGNYSDVRAASSQSGADVIITISADSHLILSGQWLAELNANDFVFG